MDVEIVILIGIGAAAGLVAGLLGVGGGIIVVPALIFLFEHQGIHSQVLMHLALGTSLATIIITSLSSIRAHHQRGAVQWKVFRSIAPGIIFGALSGALLARFINGDLLRFFFGIFLLLVATQMVIGSAAKPSRQLPGRSGMFVGGSIIGSLSSLMGVGGGTMSVPFLTWCNVPIHQAVATSSSIGLPIAIAGAGGFVVAGWGVEFLPEYSSGFVNIPAFITISLASLLCAPLGARLAHSLPARQLKMVFGLFLVIVSARILFY